MLRFAKVLQKFEPLFSFLIDNHGFEVDENDEEGLFYSHTKLVNHQMWVVIRVERGWYSVSIGSLTNLDDELGLIEVQELLTGKDTPKDEYDNLEAAAKYLREECDALAESVSPSGYEATVQAVRRARHNRFLQARERNTEKPPD